ncbi:MAG TPA: glycosyltransferase [Mycobacteriales bacterium]|nr:glycosyltransferase [Mycobacteriales bacterium]
MKVLHVLEAIGGGTARHLVDLVEHRGDIDTVVAVPAHRSREITDSTAVPIMRAFGADVRIIDMRRSKVSPVNVLAVHRLRRLIAEVRPDIVHLHSSVAGALGRVAAAGSDAAVVWTPNGLITSRGVVAVERQLARVTDAVIAVSPSERDLAVELQTSHADRTVVVPNGVDARIEPSDEPDLRRMLNIPANAPLVGSIARLTPQKDIGTFVRACRQVARRHPSTHFVLIGDGPLGNQVDELTVGWSHFHRVPFIHEARRIVNQFDVFTLTSRYEGAPYAPLEAMAARVPVVLTRVTGNCDEIIDGESGFLVERGDAPAVAKRIGELLDSPVLAERIAQVGAARVRSHFDVRRQVAETRRVYEAVLAGTVADLTTGAADLPRPAFGHEPAGRRRTSERRLASERRAGGRSA